ncbi:putative glycoside hydrolase family 92 protein [Diaporthe ampelina]|uniref:Putative glycoside hydrolase family 92 protein n=1 Tax=Diaporthe ampelina TaxID=1214573 RepID=A0A0G2FYU4_9PEZI|nr:putative glycoside hydrolase family 92 protein [Diaporthe ampelina]
MASGALPPGAKYKEKVGTPYRPKRLTRRPSRRTVVVYSLVFFLVVILFPVPGFTSFRGSVLDLIIPGHAVPKRLTPPRGVLRYIDPLIGTTNGGHVFPGATLPYGMAKPVADSANTHENAAGYVEDMSFISGFSHLHDSGTGGRPSMGQFPLFVHPGCPDDDIANCKYMTLTRAVMRWPLSSKAKPGYFSIRLKNSVEAEMTAAEHTALYRFRFPDKDSPQDGLGNSVPYSPLILVDLNDLDNTRHGGGIRVDADGTRITGDSKYRPSFGTGEYEAFFCADFKGAAVRKAGTFIQDVPDAGRRILEADPNGDFSLPPGSAGAWIQFERPQRDEILSRVGLSFISREQACRNAEREIPGWDFAAVQTRVEDAWAEKLSVVEVDETDIDPALLVTFWSGLYRTMLSPQNYTGENQLWKSDEPYFDSFYCIWDSFRAQHPLLSIIDPDAQAQMVRTLVDIYRNLGKLPDCRMAFCKGFTQGGTNADVVIADAFLKGITDGIDWETAYAAVVSDAEEEPQSWNTEGRGNLVSYHKLGYIPHDDVDNNGTGRSTRSISRTVEYAYDDFAIALLAKGLGKEDDYAKYMQRSGNWRNLWNAEQGDVLVQTNKDFQDEETVWSDFKGFLQMRGVDGSWRYHDTRACSPAHEMHRCYLDTGMGTYEGSPWLYSFYVPQDMASLIRTMGGPQLFTKRLDYFHESGIIYMGNEQSFLPVFQFHYAGRPGLSSYWAHRYIPSLFNTTFAGIPGNDDCAMGAFSGLAMMGFFPVAGQDVYLLTPPFFREVKLRARNGQWSIIRVANFDPTYEAKYIQSATLDGRAWTRSWITHDFFVHGGVLEFVVGTRESSWGTADEDLPPSWTVKTIA